MSENDLIAEYIKERHPELLNTTDFAIYKFILSCNELCKSIKKAFKKVDFKTIAEAIKNQNNSSIL